MSTRDITKRKETEEELEYEKAFLNTVLDNIKEAIVICDKEGKLILFNEAARRLHIAVKYGFVESEEAVITVTFYKDTSEKQYIFILSNSGNPFPEDIDFSSSDINQNTTWFLPWDLAW